METSGEARRWVVTIALLSAAALAMAAPVATEIHPPADESADLADVPAEAAPPPTVDPLVDARPKASEPASHRHRPGKTALDDGLPAKLGAASTPLRPAVKPRDDPAAIAVVERVFETVRAPLDAITASDEPAPVGAAPGPRRRAEMQVGSEPADAAPAAAGSGDDMVVTAVRKAREVLHEPLAWLLLLLVVGIALLVSHMTRQAR